MLPMTLNANREKKNFHLTEWFKYCTMKGLGKPKTHPVPIKNNTLVLRTS